VTPAGRLGEAVDGSRVPASREEVSTQIASGKAKCVIRVE
jgi:hypothetical protein